MGKVFLILFPFLFTFPLYGQNKDSIALPKIKTLEGFTKGLNKPLSDTSKITFCYRRRGDTTELPLFVVNKFTRKHFNEFILNSSTFKHIDILKSSEAIKVYGHDAIYGALILQISDTVELVTIKEMLDKFNIAKQYKSLPICINDDFIEKPNNIRADLFMIKSIEIKNDKYWFYTSQIDVPQKYLNITTK